MVAGAALIGPELFSFMALAQMGINQYSAPPYRAKARPVAGLWVFSQVRVCARARAPRGAACTTAATTRATAWAWSFSKYF